MRDDLDDGSVFFLRVNLEVEILQYLFNSDRFVNTLELMENLKKNRGEITKSIKLLNQYIVEYQHPEIELLNVKGKGVYLKIPIHIGIKDFKAFIISKNPKIKMLDDIFQNQFNSVTEYSNNHYLSESTVRRYLNKLREHMVSFRVGISKKNMELEGEESQIRVILLLFYWNIYQGVAWPFKNVNENQVSQIVSQISEGGFSGGKSLIEQRKMMFYIAVTLLRTRKHNFIKASPRYQQEPNSFRDFNRSFNQLAKYFPVNEAEIKFHFEVWKSFDWLNKTEIIMDWEKKQETTVAASVSSTLGKLEQVFFKISKDNLAEIERHLFSTHYFAYHFKNIDYGLNGIYYINLMNKYQPILKKKIENFLNELYVETQNEVYIEKTYLLSTYWMIFTRLDKERTFEKEVNVYIEIAQPNILYEPYILAIKSNFKNKYHLNCFIPHDKFDESIIDVVLTTNFVINLDKKYPNAVIVAVNSELNSMDYKKIAIAIEG